MYSLENIGADIVIGLLIRFLVIWAFVAVTKIKKLPKIPPALGTFAVGYYFLFAQSYEELGPFTVMGILLPEVLRFTFKIVDIIVYKPVKKEEPKYDVTIKKRKKRVHKINANKVQWGTNQ